MKKWPHSYDRKSKSGTYKSRTAPPPRRIECTSYYVPIDCSGEHMMGDVEVGGRRFLLF
jgi:hypothetical protein